MSGKRIKIIGIVLLLAMMIMQTTTGCVEACGAEESDVHRMREQAAKKYAEIQGRSEISNDDYRMVDKLSGLPDDGLIHPPHEEYRAYETVYEELDKLSRQLATASSAEPSSAAPSSTVTNKGTYTGKWDNLFNKDGQPDLIVEASGNDGLTVTKYNKFWHSASNKEQIETYKYSCTWKYDASSDVLQIFVATQSYTNEFDNKRDTQNKNNEMMFTLKLVNADTLTLTWTKGGNVEQFSRL
ncbi:MAG: hypothetical protein IK152_06140 [Lachnospiraceae bacterium]|nr:hypothetical protein [Lachnospiraceae bacterium]